MMTDAAQLSALPMVHALGWTLLHFCWQGTIVALLLACVLNLLPLRASKLRYAAACAALACLVALPLITFVVLVHQPPAPRQLIIDFPAGNPAIAPNAGPAQSAEPWTVRCETTLNRCLPVVVVSWLAGLLFFVCRLNLGLMATGRWKSTGVEPAAELEEMMQALRKRLGMERAVTLLNSARVHSPTVIGWLRPAILLPLGCLTGLSQIQIEAIFAHELAHIRRHDYLVNLLQSVMETLLFYHPAVWWASAQVRREREHCCDDLAVAITGDRFSYATALSCLEEKRSGPTPAGAFAATGGVLKMRIARLLGLNESPAFPRTAAVILLALAGTAAGVIAHGAARAQSAVSRPDSTSNQVAFDETAGAYKKWLNEEVRWIITPEEREAFLRLTSDPERDKFVQQFWARRNPNPGGVNNPFRQEHYRRIAYADAHFAASGEPGWESDRGHVYIVFGPPDSIDSHPGGGIDSTKPHEIWHYRSIQVQEPSVMNPNGSGYTAQTAAKNDFDFRFVDGCACGRYQLRSPWPSAMARNNTPVDSGSVQPVSEVRMVASTGDTSRADLSCTYYGAHNHGSEGTCATRQGHEDTYYCVKNSNRELFEEQIGCEWKVNRARSLKQRVPEIGATSSPIASATPASQSQGAASTSNVPVNVRKLTIVSDDLPEFARYQIVQEYQGRAYPLDELMERIRQNLRDRGYAKAIVGFLQPASAPSGPPPQSMDVSVLVSAGAQYTLSGFSVEGAQAFSQDEIIQQFSVHPGDLFNATAIQQGLDHLRKLYGSKGYVNLGIIPELKIDDVRHAVTVVLNIREGKTAAA
jgi:GWxTD domain-containing protein